MPVGPGRFRVVTRGGKKIRLHFTKGGKVNEAKNLESGATHTPKEFAEDRTKKRKKLPTHGSGELSPLGQRTMAGFQDKFGEAEGHKRFESAVSSGRLEKAKMFKRSAEGRFSSRTV